MSLNKRRLRLSAGSERGCGPGDQLNLHGRPPVIRQGVVEVVTDPAGRRRDAGVEQTLGEPHRRIEDGEAGSFLHTEPDTSNGLDGFGGPADFDVCRALTTEEINQQLARKSSDANRGFPSPGSYGVGRPGPLPFEPHGAYSPNEEP